MKNKQHPNEKKHYARHQRGYVSLNLSVPEEMRENLRRLSAERKVTMKVLVEEILGKAIAHELAAVPQRDAA